MRDRPYVVAIGGANVDIAGRPNGPLVARDSNLGSIRLSHGGVARNIAHNLALLGIDVELITTFGSDALADSLVEGCTEAGIGIAHSFTVPGHATSTYLYVTDSHGEMQVAINDMAILDELTGERLEARKDLVNGASLVLVDTNVPAATLEWVARNVCAPIFCDPISTVKARKLGGLLGSLHTLKPNLLEAEALSGERIHDGSSLDRAAQTLVSSGLERVFISLGADGLHCAEQSESCRLPLLPCRVVDTTGGGDAMMAGLIWAHLHDLDLRQSGLAGLAASAIAVESDRTVSAAMSERHLLERMSTLRSYDDSL
ncbi:MAG: MarR family transcriptional regulator [Atopobiaceae bacterium]|nr:MarR family transcriptional regulator [Atopobiaceae bacterium]